MYMILHLMKEKYLDDILMALTEAGIEDTIVLSGESLGHKMAYDIPYLRVSENRLEQIKALQILFLPLQIKKKLILCSMNSNIPVLNLLKTKSEKLFFYLLKKIY